MQDDTTERLSDVFDENLRILSSCWPHKDDQMEPLPISRSPVSEVPDSFSRRRGEDPKPPFDVI